MKKNLFVLMFLAVLLVCTSVFADDLDDVFQSGVLRFGVPSEYIPFVFTDEDGNPTGIDVALMEEIGNRMGVQVEVIHLAYDGMIDALNLGQVDVVGGAYAITAERAEQIDFSIPYYKSDAKFIGRAGMEFPDTVSPETFRDMRIGVQKGTSFDQWVKANLVSGGFVSPMNVYVYASVEEEMEALNSGDVDLVLLDNDVYELGYADSGDYDIYYDGFVTETYAFGLRKDSYVTDVINEHLSDMLKDKTAQSIASYFFNMDFSEASLIRDRSSMLLRPVYVYAPEDCVKGMVFVSDVTIKDGQTLYAGESFTKVWRVKNTGTCTWTPDYSFVFTSGSRMGGSDIRVPQKVAPGQTVDLSIDMIAPYTNGTYKGFWQMRSPYGVGFGQTVWAKIRVNGSAAAPAQYLTDDGQVYEPVSIYSFYPDYFVGEEGQCVTAFWSTGGADLLDISVDGSDVMEDSDSDGAYEICGPVSDAGEHIIQLHAYNVTASDYASFIYTVLDSDGWEEWYENTDWDDGRDWVVDIPEPEYVIDYPEGIQDPDWEPDDPDINDDPDDLTDPDKLNDPDDLIDPDKLNDPDDLLDPDKLNDPDDLTDPDEWDDGDDLPDPDDLDDGDDLSDPDDLDDSLCDPDDPDYLECLKELKEGTL